MNGKTILLVEDNHEVMRNNATLLSLRGASVMSAETLAEARSVIKEKAIDLIVLDIMLPDGSGLDFLKELRENNFQLSTANCQTHSLPVMLLTAKDESDDIVTGLSLGADDYLAKPYFMNVFAARIDALLRRARTVSKVIDISPLRFDMISNQAFCSGVDLLLTQKEFALLLLLAQNERKNLTAEYLYENVWGQPLTGDNATFNATFKVQMSNLKKKLTAVTGNILIETSRGEGYCLTIL